MSPAVQPARSAGLLPIRVLGWLAVGLLTATALLGGAPRSVLANDVPGSSAAPSDAPSAGPSQLPSQAPSEAPSQAPSDAPSDAPSGLPSEQPSQPPSEAPSQLPSEAPSAAPSEAPTGMVMIMKHVCPASVQSEADFDALGGFLAKVLTCPVVTRPGDVGPAGALDADDDFFDVFVAGGEIHFDFSVHASNGSADLGDAEFLPAKVCETDVNADANGDGRISADVCIEVSHYGLDGVGEGSVTITETTAPAGFRTGSIEFSPMSGDDATLVSFDPSTGTIVLDTTADDATSGDGEAGPHAVMVHVYNFANAAAPSDAPTGGVEGATGRPSVTPPATDTPSATSGPSNDGWRVVLLAIAGLATLALVLTPRPVRVRRDDGRRR